LYQNPEKKGAKTMKRIFSILTVLFMVFGLTASASATVVPSADAYGYTFNCPGLPWAYADAGTYFADWSRSYAVYSDEDEFYGWSAAASANLATGQLSAHALSTKRYETATALSQAYDKVTLWGIPAGTGVDLTVNFYISGNMDTVMSPLWELHYARAYGNLVYEPQSDFFQLGSYGVDGYYSEVFSQAFDPMMVTIDYILSKTFHITAGSPFGLSYWLMAHVRGNSSADFGHTATLSFDLPEGTSISSEGGFSQSPASIPEPTTILLLGSGLIGLAAYRRKKFFKK
jgi:hypothetical protein